MKVKNAKDVEGLKVSGRIVAACLRYMAKAMQPGMTTRDLDALGAAFLKQEGAESAPIVTYKFPGTTCISINEQAAHGIPGDRVIHAGDLVNIDVSAVKDGFFADTGGSFIVGKGTKQLEELCAATKRALDNAVKAARAGEKLSVIGREIEAEALRCGFTVIENLGSHGVGRKLHEEPGFIPGYEDTNDKRVLKKDMVITIEPFLSTGSTWVEEQGDGWTLVTESQFRTAQYEHTMIITDGEPIVVTV